MTSLKTDDANAILLLCAVQRGDAGDFPLSLTEYNRVATVLHRSNRRPGDLLWAESLSEIAINAQINPVRLQQLLDRRVNLGFSLEEWQRKGIWVLARSDPDYPEAIRKSMRNAAPPLLFGTGPLHLLDTGGLAMIGPDSIPGGRIEKVVQIAVKESRTVIVAGHLKMAREIVQAVEKHQGSIIWVLHDGALKQRLQKSHRHAIHNQRMMMVTPQSPDTPKTLGEPSNIGLLAMGFADQVLYVDGSNFNESNKRKDRFETKSAALKRSKICTLLHGRKISPEGQKFAEHGVQSWAAKRSFDVEK